MARTLTPARLAADLKAKHKSVTLMGDGAPARVKHVCPTGLAVLDRWVLGLGGLPYGRMVEIYGKEGGGKDTIMDRILAGAQKDGAIACLIETEHKWDPSWAKLQGVDLESLVFDQPDSTESAQALIEDLVKKSSEEKRLVICLNSVAATASQKEVDEGVTGDAAMGEQGRLWSKFCRIIVPLLDQHQAMLILINQVRNKIGVMYGNPEITPAGVAIKHHSYLRLSVSHGAYEQENTKRLMKIRAMKNQVCPPMREAILKLDFATGFDERWSVLNYAKEVGAVAKASRSYKEAMKNLGWDDGKEVAEETTEVETTEVETPAEATNE